MTAEGAAPAEGEGGVIRRQYIFHGRVQGVGFRYTASSLARRYPISGYVKNRPDGTVELVAEGMPGDLAQLLADIQQHFAGHISNIETETLPVENRPGARPPSFTIRY